MQFNPFALKNTEELSIRAIDPPMCYSLPFLYCATVLPLSNPSLHIYTRINSRTSSPLQPSSPPFSLTHSTFLPYTHPPSHHPPKKPSLLTTPSPPHPHESLPQP